MAFGHATGTAADAPNFFVRLEGFFSLIGWTLTSGGGTTDIVYRSTGELNIFSKLYVRVWRDAVNLNRVWARVQDDAAGTNVTTTGSLGYLDCPGLGAAPFDYWLSGDKNCIIMNMVNAGNYCTIYAGTVEPFSLLIADETMRHCIVTFHTWDTVRPYCRMLRRYSGAYDYLCRVGGIQSLVPETLTNSKTLTGCYAYNTADYSEIYGMLYYITWYLPAGLGMAALDTVTSGYPSEVTSQWIVFTNAASGRWAVMTTVKIPLGKAEDSFTADVSVVTDWVDFDAKLVAILTGLGWVSAAWHAPTYATDRYWTSAGESGAEDIRLRIAQQTTNFYMACVSQNAIGFQTTTISVTQISDSMFPVPVYFIADKNCILVFIMHENLARYSWAGKPITYYPDESLIPFEYKEISVEDTASPVVLRQWSGGLWNRVISEVSDNQLNSSPNRVDGTTMVVWPKVYRDANALLFALKYLYYVSSDNLCLGDSIYVGDKWLRYIAPNLCIREE